MTPINTTDTLSKDYGATVLRVSLGVILLAHALLKIVVFTIPGTVAFFGSIGLPPIAAYLTIFGELSGGLALIAGIFTRLAAALSLPILLGATWAHIGNGWVFTSPNGGWEFPAFLTAAALAVALQGPGAFSLGAYLNRTMTLTKIVTA